MGEIYEQEEASIGEPEIITAIEQGRGEKTEFYASVSGNEAEISKTACSFANTGGGQILLGVDKSGNIIGLEGDSIEDDIKSIFDDSLQRRLDRTYVTSEEVIDGEVVVIVLMNEFQDHPLMSNGRFYLRDQTDDLLLAPDQVWDLMNECLDSSSVD